VRLRGGVGFRAAIARSGRICLLLRGRSRRVLFRIIALARCAPALPHNAALLRSQKKKKKKKKKKTSSEK